MSPGGQKHVVYLLGAGFSQPLGIPTIASFLDRAKTLQQGNPETFAYFDKIFDTINVLERAHNFYRTDRTSIEDALTMLDLKEGLAGTSDSQLFKRFIADVVQSYTPKIVANSSPQRWSSLFFGEPPWTSYGGFVSALLGYEFRLAGTPKPNAVPTLNDYQCQIAAQDVRYSVISLNYDLVLERMARHLNDAFRRSDPTFVSSTTASGTPLVKLHGSVDNPDSIVPPLWNKQYVEVAGLWREAFTILQSANQIRVLGYSLPVADTYIRYLLRSAAVQTKHLQRIDVICMDDTGRAQRRYGDFITFKDYRRGKDRRESFNNANVYGYLAFESHTEQWPKVIQPSDILERFIHPKYFGQD